MKFKDRNLRALAECIIGDKNYFKYKSSMFITEFLRNVIYHLSMMVLLLYWTVERLNELLKNHACKTAYLKNL